MPRVGPWWSYLGYGKSPHFPYSRQIGPKHTLSSKNLKFEDKSLGDNDAQLWARLLTEKVPKPLPTAEVLRDAPVPGFT